MGVREAHGDLRHEVECVHRPHRAGLFEQLGEVTAADELHRDEELVLVLSVVVDLDHMR